MKNKKSINKNKKIIKLCPELKKQEEIKAVLIGSGDVVVTYFIPCIKEKCCAYSDGFCRKFQTPIYFADGEKDDQ